jgi:hypothetical protein
MTVLRPHDGICANFETMTRRRLRSQTEVIDRCRLLRGELRAALDLLPSDDPAVIDTVWRGEALGTLLWALQLAELPPYDLPFTSEDVVEVDAADGRLRAPEQTALERDSARLWHWRARTAALRNGFALPAQYETLEQLIAATAMRGYEDGLLPAPLRGDFAAFGKVYRQLTAGEQSEAHSIAVERHHALNWLAGEGATWDDVPVDT